ncbi:hypothetical protein EYZ11_007626 [Aspergillus tanneri]|uniref:Allergen Asp f 15 n=1 Tax=Aspergillus tanneri TaxID=1220188 RepID=A0A4S3JCU7_9EURO|nr:uncharacterized protein ATNIH1004_003464 [Aspergillus tanneri]KAA8650775.1 hypothetical protein ATNIH1004_003464 [Aspergillus tanneri]THC92902.1 hypothetical protein EYZ11_007626 [Aspergillus tanneri]
MKFFASTLAVLSLSLSSAVAAPVEAASDAAASTSISVSYDPKYDVGGSSLTTVACSDGVYGLIPRGYSTFGSLPSFPRIGGAPTIPGWNSPNCGKCYSLHYKAGPVDKTIYMTAVDAAPGGFNLGVNAMNELTNGQAVQLGRVQADYAEVDPSLCGFK